MTVVTAGSNEYATSEFAVAYVHVETRADRLRWLSNVCALSCERLMASGVDESTMFRHAQLADELAELADFLEPPQDVTVTASGTFGGSGVGQWFQC